MFAWFKERGITAVITGERGVDTLTRQGLEEYVSDCVILLDHRVAGQISTRRLRIVKYRGSSHGTNEYPFLIDRRGIAVLPITSLQLIHKVTSDRVSTGLDWLDEMFGGRGYFRASSVLLSGSAGTAKTTIASCFLDAACRRGERALCFQFEESPAQYTRNMHSVGLDLDRWVKKGLLRIHAARPTLYGLEFHLATMHREIDDAEPSVVVVDPLSSFSGATHEEINSMVMRLIDFLKGKNITALFTHLIHGSGASQEIEVGVSSLIDTWILLRNSPPGEQGGRHLSILKSRGMSHSSERRSFELTDSGVVVQPAGSTFEDRTRGGRMKRGVRGMKALGKGKKKKTARSEEWILRLYVAGQSARSAAALRNLEAICEEHLAGRYRIAVIDLLKQPQLARGDQIVAVPTLVRHLPPPMKKIIGDLSNEESVLVGLDLRQRRRRPGARP